MISQETVFEKKSEPTNFPLQLLELPDPLAGHGDVLVRVRAAGKGRLLVLDGAGGVGHFAIQIAEPSARKSAPPAALQMSSLYDPLRQKILYWTTARKIL